MALQIIICVESDKRAGTDNIYIKETLEHFYVIDNSVNLNFVNMGGKSKYDSSDVKKQINTYIRDYKLGDSVVVLCVDTDQLETNYEQKMEFEQIERFAMSMDYELVWFCHDVEEVYIGNSIVKDAKKRTSIDFKKKGERVNVDKKKLDCREKRKGCSNVMQVFDKYLKRIDIPLK